ncbi:hypothetical protein ULF88_01240 [Halopseudomonas pachastrellae]|nr:hypothetical protein [Halopseudomonas pachastrellae]
MESNILQALPNIHGILIGIGTAFFSGFAMFAYQKLQESKDRLDKVLADVEFFSTPSNFIGGGNTSLVTDKGELDWDGEAKILIHHAKSYFHIWIMRKNTASQGVSFRTLLLMKISYLLRKTSA